MSIHIPPPAPPDRRSNRTIWIGVGLGAVVVTLSLVAILILAQGCTDHCRSASPRQPATTVTAPGAPSTTTDGPVRTGTQAQDELRRLADELRPSQSDATQGPYAYTEVWQWAHGPDPDDPARWRPMVTRQQRWRDAIGAGREVRWDHTGGGCRQDDGDVRWSSGMPGLLPPGQEPARDADGLRRQLGTPDGFRPGTAVSAIAMMADASYPDLQARAATLRLLASLPGIELQNGADPLGRRGVQVTVAERDTVGGLLGFSMLFDASGHLLVFERTVVEPPATPEPGYVENVVGYRLYTAAQRTRSVDSPPAGCEHNSVPPGTAHVGGR
ncbi:hypothetical protein [Micromonospora sp. CPCC 206061]|uniref:hypothetical protein n=1 Tax=Micromonospora sp. CPCC 206061 TaxID=3122410 RepID=UPI002FF1CFD7